MDLTSFGVEKKDNTPSEITDENLVVDFDKIKKDFKAADIERFLPWFLKYQINNFEDLILTKEIEITLDYIENFDSKKYKDKGLLLHGPPGCGKTTTLNLIGKYLNLEIFELNASDARSKKSIIESVGDVIKQRSLFGGEKLILIDEVDGVSGNKDRGGVAELVKFLKNKRYAIVFTANDIESQKIKSLKKKCITVDFTNSSYDLLIGIGKRILDSENVEYDKKLLEEFILKRDSSDIRGFINDLQSNTINNKFVIDENIEIRDYKKKIEKLLDTIYYSYPDDSVKSTFNSDVNLDDLLLFLEENTPEIYLNKDLILALNEISKADIFRGRIMRWQYWRFLVYVNFYLTYGVSSVKTNVKKSKYKKNSRILKKWIYNNKVNALRPRTKVEKKNEVPLKFIEQLAKYYKCSATRCRKRDLFYFALSYKNDEEFRESMDKQFNIDEATKKALLEL